MINQDLLVTVMISALGMLLAALAAIAGILGKVMLNSIHSKIESCHNGLKDNLEHIWKDVDDAHSRLDSHIKDFHSK